MASAGRCSSLRHCSAAPRPAQPHRCRSSGGTLRRRRHALRRRRCSAPLRRDSHAGRTVRSSRVRRCHSLSPVGNIPERCSDERTPSRIRSVLLWPVTRAAVAVPRHQAWYARVGQPCSRRCAQQANRMNAAAGKYSAEEDSAARRTRS